MNSTITEETFFSTELSTLIIAILTFLAQIYTISSHKKFRSECCGNTLEYESERRESDAQEITINLNELKHERIIRHKSAIVIAKDEWKEKSTH